MFLMPMSGSRRNFGDTLWEILIELFDMSLLPPGSKARDNLYFLIGSVLSEGWIEAVTGALRSAESKVVFWGCGWRGEPVSQRLLARADIASVRGPRTARGLALDPALALGDTGFLLPLLRPRIAPISPQGVLAVPHFLDPRHDELLAAPHLVGASAAVSPIVQSKAETEAVIRMISQAEFVLAGAMHSAVVAAAYDVPFAFLDNRFIDCPEKWHDLAESMGLQARFVTDIEGGRAAYAEQQPTLRMPSLRALLDASPLPVKPEYRQRASAHDVARGLPVDTGAPASTYSGREAGEDRGA